MDAARFSSRFTAACDAVMDFAVLAFAAWTVAYHACLVLRLDAGWAAAGAAAALLPCGALAARRRPLDVAPGGADGGPPSRRQAGLRAASAACAVAAAAAFALADAPWPVVWALWIAAAAGAVAAASAGRPTVDFVRLSRTRSTLERVGGAAAAAGWAAALGVLSLFLVRPDGDDAYYLRSATWIAERGRFPLRDVLYSDERLPALFWPPVPSYEGLLGTLARATRATVPDVAYHAATPLVTALAVLATWRLLRTWRVRRAGLALSVAMVFLLTTVQSPELVGLELDQHLPGNFFVARAWQGKVVLAALLVPVLLALLHEHAECPSLRGLALLGVAGTAAVGLSTTGIFLVPVIAAGCLAPLALRAPRRAAAGAAAAMAYPVAAGAATLIAGGRTPAEWPKRVVTPEELLPPALGTGTVGLVAVTAALAAPLLLRHAPAARMIAAAVLLAGCLFAPGVPGLIYELTGLGKPLWRLTWAIPIAALVGVLTTQLPPRGRLALLPAATVCAALAVSGTLVWNGAHTALADRPAWKRPPHDAVVHAVLAHARPGDLVLAPRRLSQTLVIVSARITAVAPRVFYTRALAIPAARSRARLRLTRFAVEGLGELRTRTRVRRALARLGVDIACVAAELAAAQALLRRAGYAHILSTPRIWCGRISARARPPAPARAARPRIARLRSP